MNQFLYMFNQIFVIFGAMITFFSGVIYIVMILKGKVKPNKVTWLLWTISPFIALSSQIKQGVGIPALLTFAVGFTPFTVFICSFINKKSYWKITKFDIICGSISIIGVILWIITKIANVAIVFSICADFMATLPTIVKAYNAPETESSIAFFLGFIGALLVIPAIQSWTFQEYGFIGYITLMNLLLAVLIKFRLGKYAIKYSY